jgi:hypothetical protein
MSSVEFLAALNNVYYISMPMFNESAIAGSPAEYQAVFKQLSDGGSTIEDITSEIAVANPNSGVTPEIVFQILTQLEQSGLVAHSDAVSGYSGMIISNSANNVLSTDSLALGNMFSNERLSPVLNSSKAITELGNKEDKRLVDYQTKSPLSADNIPLSASSPEIAVSEPKIAVSDPQLSSSVPPISSSPEIKASTPQIGFGQK